MTMQMHRGVQRARDPSPPTVPLQYDARAVVLLFALVPLVFIDQHVAGFALTGWAWVLGLLASLPLVLAAALSRSSVRRLTPYLLFLSLGSLGLAWAPSLPRGIATLTQLLAPVVAFALASHVTDPDRVVPVLRRTALVGLLTAVGIITAASAGVLPTLFAFSARPTAIALVVLFCVATLGASRRQTVLLSVLSVVASASTGSRTATAVLLVAVLLSPAWRLRWRGRAALLLLGVVAVLAFSQTAAFQHRFFFSEKGSLGDALTGSSTLNTAGRRELWPKLLERCGQRPWLGAGPGAASEFSSEFTFGVLVQPHNDYLRTYCDEGLVGAVPFWGFFVVCAAAGLRSAVLRRDPVGAAAGQLVVSLLLLALTDNVIIYTAHFMVPTAVVLGLALRQDARSEAIDSRGTTPRRRTVLRARPARPDRGPRRPARAWMPGRRPPGRHLLPRTAAGPSMQRPGAAP